MGNGAKAQQRQQRNAKKGADSGGKRQVDSINPPKCQEHPVFGVQTDILVDHPFARHVENKHSGKTVADCFPNYQE
ncbi:hypothetical protein RhiJN_19707 [Ceratobasidium sp. AG-Ba]|nr:hypothetical protein RhiJN_04877 [Ceratobasidium sp. AG-Ba]QRV91689.1 hypothetical protein RhiJN_19707 [Ceratobasidium sp. AG-Ba]